MPDQQKMFTVTTHPGKLAFSGDRNVALCTTLERAKEIVETNELDIFEGDYIYAVIEDVYADCMYGGVDRQQWWYRWNTATTNYLPCETPEMFQNTSGFAIG